MKNQITIMFCLFALLTCSSASYAQKSSAVLAELALEFNNVVGDKPLKLQDGSYSNEAGEKFSVTTFNYFVSNIKLHQKEGKEYVIPQDSSYFLIKENDPASRKINLKVPEGQYTAVTFTIGVDSLRSTMDISRRTGALDIAGGMLDGMYWTWNSGYLFMKFEGDSPQAELDRTGQRKFRYHIGGFGGYNKPSVNNIRTVTIDLSKKGAVKAKKNAISRVVLQTDASRVFNGKTKVSIAANSTVMFGDFSRLISENYTQMFSHISTKN
ncbi:MbnP family protein [Flavobacterium johnsoniae]|uniref:MbnP family protein n=1 Tax=Flavobacterium johnsoniae TaxID=986 RepID=UPI0011EF17FF|nr:MbnP family protein [Flavobacterium johnsoniae]